MLLFPRAARVQSGSPYNKDFTTERDAAGYRFILNYSAETNAASTLDCKLQYWTGTAWADLVDPAETAIDFVQFTGVGVQTLTVYPQGKAVAEQELTTAPTLVAYLPLPKVLRAVVTLAGGAGGDTVTFSLDAERLA